jgi:hypothetical protein
VSVIYLSSLPLPPAPCNIDLTRRCGNLALSNGPEGLAITGGDGANEFNGVLAEAPTQDTSCFLDDHLLAELGWTSGTANAFFYPPPIAGPYGSTEWYNSPTDVNGFAI